MDFVRLKMARNEKPLPLSVLFATECSLVRKIHYLLDSRLVMASFYKYHLFFCTNQRESGRACCANHNAQALRDHMKARIKALGLTGKGGIRINTAGCMDRCALGPALVVYPEATWYRYQTEQDIEEIIKTHLQNGQIVSRLLLE